MSWHFIDYMKVWEDPGATAPSELRLPLYRGFIITLRHKTLGRTPLDE